MRVAARFAVALLATTAVGGFRVQKRRRQDGSQVTTQGEVEGLYTFGAPATSTPGLRNAQRDDGCFAGERIVSTRSWYLLPTQMDAIPKLARLVPFISDLRHPMMEVLEMDHSGTHSKTNRLPCAPNVTDLPNYIADISLHMAYPFHTYLLSSDFIATVTAFGLAMQYLDNELVVKGTAWSRGWRLVHSARTDGGSDAGGGHGGGPQVSHLFQHPETLECMETFQASASFEDWQANFDSTPEVGFCGLPNAIHRGFRDHLRNMIWGDDWQANIRPKLPSCSKVWIAGTSLGGAAAELFAACVQNAPRPQDDPAGDYQDYFGWTKGTPQQLPYL